MAQIYFERILGNLRRLVGVSDKDPLPQEIYSRPLAGGDASPVGPTNPLITQASNQFSVLNSVVSVLTYTGDEVIPVPDGAYSITVNPSLDVIVTIANSALPAVPNVDGIINGGAAYRCLAGQSMTIPMGTNLTYNAMRITGKAGTKTTVGFNGGTVVHKGSVLAGCYPAPVNSGGEGYADGPDERFNYNNQTRIRQDGNITGVKLWRNLYNGISELSIAIWRRVGTSYRLVGRSENFIAKTVNANSLQTITFDTPIYGARQGDFISIRATGALLPYGAHIYTTFSGAKSYWSDTSIVSYDGVAWASRAGSSTTRIYVAQVMMEAPKLVGIGDSLIQCAAYGAGYVHVGTESIVPAPRSTVMGMASELLGSRYFQNMGWGGEKTNLTAARHAADCVALKPDYAVYLVGVNDIGLTATSTRRESTKTLATITAPAHQLKTGNVVTMTGFTNPQFNVASVPVTVLTVDTFTVPIVGGSIVADGADTGGVITVDEIVENALENWAIMLAQSVAAGIKPVVILPIPWTSGDNAELIKLDALRAGLIAMAPTYNALVVDPVQELGQNRSHIHITHYSRSTTNKTVANAKRVANVATIETTTAHGLDTGDRVVITATAFGGVADTSFNSADAPVTVIDSLHFSYPSTGTAKAETAATAGNVTYAVAAASCAGHSFEVGMLISVSNMVDPTFDRDDVKVSGASANSFYWHSFGDAVSLTADTEQVGQVACPEVMTPTNYWDLKPTCDYGDGLHMQAAGNMILGGLVADAIKAYEGAL